jgi:ABC-type uncharacterized transport system auxiliary subunit
MTREEAMRLAAALVGALALAGCGGASVTTTPRTGTSTTQSKPAPPKRHTQLEKPTPTKPEGSRSIEEIESRLRVVRENLAYATSHAERNYLEAEIGKLERERRARHGNAP